MQKKTAALLLAPALGAGLVAWAFRSKPYRMQADGCATVTAAGRIRLALMRQFIKGFRLTTRHLGLPQIAMRTIEHREAPTTYGPAEVTFYWPAAATTDPLPVYVNFHGGGFVLGYAPQDDLPCRYLAHHTPCLVINVDYVLAPEHPFPAPVLQSYEVVKWVHDQAPSLGYDASRLAVGGHSAGGSLSAAVALLAKERQEFSLALQILDYPSLNLAPPAEEKNLLPQRKQVLSPELTAFFKHLYAPCPADWINPLASPLLAADVTGLAPALIITAEYDLLRDEGNDYAEKLRQHGVPVTHREFKGADHAFTHHGPQEAARQAWNLMRMSLKEAFQPPQDVAELDLTDAD